MLIAAYLWLNAAIYGLFALWCTAAPAKTSQAAGYAVLDVSGRSEYQVITVAMKWPVSGTTRAIAGMEIVPLLFAAGLAVLALARTP